MLVLAVIGDGERERTVESLREHYLRGRLSVEELTERLGRASGRQVRYQQVPWDDWERQVGHELTVMWRWFEEHGYHVDTALVRQEYPQLTGFDRWLSQHWLLRRTA